MQGTIPCWALPRRAWALRSPSHSPSRGIFGPISQLKVQSLGAGGLKGHLVAMRRNGVGNGGMKIHLGGGAWYISDLLLHPTLGGCPSFSPTQGWPASPCPPRPAPAPLESVHQNDTPLPFVPSSLSVCSFSLSAFPATGTGCSLATHFQPRLLLLTLPERVHRELGSSETCPLLL